MTFIKNKYKPVEPIDYDEYIEKNRRSLKKDNLKNLIFVHENDIYVNSFFYFFLFSLIPCIFYFQQYIKLKSTKKRLILKMKI